MRLLVFAFLLAALAGYDPARAQATTPEPRLVVKDVWLLKGGFPPKREPDGNTVIFRAPEGLIVLDTGRHSGHQEAIVPIEASQRMIIGGRVLDVRLAPDAATAGDVWLYDPKARVAAVGDLVTLPAPFLDTACPAGWRRALGEIWATPFQIALPGHGPPLTRASFAAWRSAFDALMDCSASAKPKEACAAAWVEGVRPLLDSGQLALDRATGMTQDYVGLLRANGGKSPFCQAAG